MNHLLCLRMICQVTVIMIARVQVISSTEMANNIKTKLELHFKWTNIFSLIYEAIWRFHDILPHFFFAPLNIKKSLTKSYPQ